jgi:NTE family protein
MRIHLIASDVLTGLGASSKFNAEWDFLRMLRDEGRLAADRFLTANSDNVGKRSSVDLDILLQQV